MQRAVVTSGTCAGAVVASADRSAHDIGRARLRRRRFRTGPRAFEANFSERGDVGASVAVYRDGVAVVDLCGGRVGPEPDAAPYRPDALQLVFSTTKGATALCAHMLVDRGLLDPAAPVSEYWPEFATHGKGDAPVEWLLTHKVGLPDIDRPMTRDDALRWDPAVEALAASEPLWEPGTRRGYHAVTFGWLVGEIVRRVSGMGVGEFFRREVAEPLGLDMWIGLPPELDHRVVPVIPLGPPPGLDFGASGPPPGGMIGMLEMLMGPGSIIGRALSAPGGAFADQESWNLPEVWHAEVPSANMIGNAASIARMYAASIGEVDGVRLLSDGALRDAIEVKATGPDSVLVFDIPFGSGFMRSSPLANMGSPGAFGHFGAGGSLGFADPDRGIAFGYAMNKMELGVSGDPRTVALVEALDACE
ncbi:MAG: serine hydrolase domain-containing protein [Microthrixaceae bacterium]